MSRSHAVAIFIAVRSLSAMLILSRRTGESFLIGDNVRVTVLNARGSQVRLGIDAPEDTVVHRKEIYERMLLEQQNPDSYEDDSLP
jgi:carbon storage regulator